MKTSMQQKNNYSVALIFSIAMHLLLLAFIIISVSLPSHLPPVVKKGHALQIVKAVAVNQGQVEQEVARLKRQQQAKKQAEIDFARKMRDEALTAKREKEAQAHALTQLQDKQRALQRKQAEQAKLAKEQLARIQSQQAKAKKELAQIQVENQKAISAQKAAEARIAKLKKEKALANKRREQDAKDLLTQQLKQEQKQLAAQKAQYINGVIDKYRALIVNQIESHWITPPNVNQSLKLTLQIQLDANGQVENVSLVKSSGNSVLDRTAVNAVYKASPLPVPKSALMFAKFKQFSILMTPNNLISG